MQHYYQNIQGWFSYEWIYCEMVARAPSSGARFVEIGCWKGRSSVFLAVETINSGKQIELNFIDTWAGSNEEDHQTRDEVINDTLYSTWQKNMTPFRGKFNHFRIDSVRAAELFEDRSVDFIMIDGAHEEESVIKDINAWLPKMKIGGIMTGDDCWEGTGPRAAAEKVLAKYNVTFPSNHFFAIIE